MNKWNLVWDLLLVFSVVIFGSCNEKPNNDISPSLISFEIKKDNNSSIKESINFQYDENDSCFKASYLKWIETDKPGDFIPSFSYTGDRITINGIDVVSGQSVVSFAEDLVRSVFNGREKHDYKISLICPQINTELPVLRIDMDAEDFKEEYKWIESRVMLHNPKNGIVFWSYTDEPVNIRGRGNSTWVLPKKPYRVKFPKKVRPLEGVTTEAKNWVLLAHDMDKSLIRNHLGFCIARELQGGGGIFVPLSRFVNIYFKDQYHGLYQLTDHLERADGRVTVEKLDAKTGDSPDVITGGYILESVINVDDPAVHFITARGFGFDLKYPKDDDHLETQYQWIENHVQLAEDALFGKAFSDPNSGWRRYFDEQSLVDYIITKEFVGDMDGYVSTRLYKKRDDEHFYFGPVWDMDKGWGNDNRTPHEKYPPKRSLMIYAGFRMSLTSGDDWFCRFWQDANLRKAVAARWNQVKEALVLRVLSEVDSCQKNMTKSVVANFEVWPFKYQASEFAPVPSGDYVTLLDDIREMTTERAALLDLLFK